MKLVEVATHKKFSYNDVSRGQRWIVYATIASDSDYNEVYVDFEGTKSGYALNSGLIDLLNDDKSTLKYSNLGDGLLEVRNNAFNGVDSAHASADLLQAEYAKAVNHFTKLCAGAHKIAERQGGVVKYILSDDLNTITQLMCFIVLPTDDVKRVVLLLPRHGIVIDRPFDSDYDEAHQLPYDDSITTEQLSRELIKVAEQQYGKAVDGAIYHALSPIKLNKLRMLGYTVPPSMVVKDSNPRRYVNMLIGRTRL